MRDHQRIIPENIDPEKIRQQPKAKVIYGLIDFQRDSREY
jgi:hypothetical protein